MIRLQLSIFYLGNTSKSVITTKVVASTVISTARCQANNILDETLDLISAESITEVGGARAIVIGHTIQNNRAGWTPSTNFATLDIEFRSPVEVNKNTTILALLRTRILFF
jgi:hypothetical protein